jgi:hypothetical protein
MPSSYYSAVVAPGWRLVVLDTTEMSPHSGYPEVKEGGRWGLHKHTVKVFGGDKCLEEIAYVGDVICLGDIICWGDS